MREARAAVISKAPSSWRRDDSGEPGSMPRASHRARGAAGLERFQVENPHCPKGMPRARSTSLNPIIYPDWWGHEYDATAAHDDRGFI